MNDEERRRDLTLNIPGITELIGSLWAKSLAVLAAVSIILGIALEAQSLVGGYFGVRKAMYDMQKASAEMCDIKAKAVTSSIAGYTQLAGNENFNIGNKVYVNGVNTELVMGVYTALSQECAELIAPAAKPVPIAISPQAPVQPQPQPTTHFHWNDN